MTGDQFAGMIAGFMCLTLVGANLLARRLALGTVIRLALIWMAIFAVAAVVFSWLLPAMAARSPASERSGTRANLT